MKPQYDGPFIVISRNCEGTYILCQLDGSIFHRPIAAFRLLLYHACNSIYLPDDMMDINTHKLQELEQSNVEDDINSVTIEVATEYVDEEEEEMKPKNAKLILFTFHCLFYFLLYNSSFAILLFLQCFYFCNFLNSILYYFS